MRHLPGSHAVSDPVSVESERVAETAVRHHRQPHDRLLPGRFACPCRSCLHARCEWPRLRPLQVYKGFALLLDGTCVFGGNRDVVYPSVFCASSRRRLLEAHSPTLNTVAGSDGSNALILSAGAMVVVALFASSVLIVRRAVDAGFKREVELLEAGSIVS